MANFCTFIGRLGADPEFKHIESRGGAPVPLVEFSLASDRYRNDAPLWVKVAVWDERLQRLVMSHLKKGSSIAVDGSLDAKPYANKQTGDVNPGLQLKASRIEFVGGKKDDNSGNSQSSYDDF